MSFSVTSDFDLMPLDGDDENVPDISVDLMAYMLGIDCVSNDSAGPVLDIDKMFLEYEAPSAATFLAVPSVKRQKRQKRQKTSAAPGERLTGTHRISSVLMKYGIGPIDRAANMLNATITAVTRNIARHKKCSRCYEAGLWTSYGNGGCTHMDCRSECDL